MSVWSVSLAWCADCGCPSLPYDWLSAFLCLVNWLILSERNTLFSTNVKWTYWYACLHCQIYLTRIRLTELVDSFTIDIVAWLEELENYAFSPDYIFECWSCYLMCWTLFNCWTFCLINSSEYLYCWMCWQRETLFNHIP